MHVTTIEVLLLLLSGVLIVVCAFLAWRLIVCLQSVSLSGFRAQDRERRDMFHLFERLVEKRDTSPSREHIVLPLHSGERMQETASSSEMEKEALKEEKRNGSPPLVSTEPGAEVDDYVKLFE